MRGNLGVIGVLMWDKGWPRGVEVLLLRGNEDLLEEEIRYLPHVG